MPANLRKIMSEVPRPLEVSARDSRNEQTPLGRKRLSEKEVARRVEPLLALVASGDIPVDNHVAQAIRTYVEHKHGTIER